MTTDKPKTIAEAMGEPAPNEHTDARHKAQLEKMQAAFADNLIDAFNTLVLQASRIPESALSTLTIAQMDELMDCLRTTVTTPPPEGGQPFVEPEEPTG